MKKYYKANSIQCFTNCNRDVSVKIGSTYCKSDCIFFDGKGADENGTFVVCKHGDAPIRTRPEQPDKRTGWGKQIPKIGDEVLVKGVVIAAFTGRCLVRVEDEKCVAVLYDKIHSIL